MAQRKRPVRLGCQAFALIGVLLVIGAGGRLLLFQGLLRPVRVASGSMAERFFGGHYEVHCAECRFPFRYGLELPPDQDRAVCPNCGHRDNLTQPQSLRRGQRVLIDRLALLTRAPRRWETVAFRSPDEDRQLAVKRVVGLPGERVALRHGDVYINDQLARKSLDQLRSMAILVHDNAYRPTPPARSPRWQADRPDSGWRIGDNPVQFRFEPAAAGTVTDDRQASAGAPLDWLTYRHRRCFQHPAPRSEEVPVLDHYGYNQGLSRQLHEVTDLLLVCRLQMTGAGRVALRATDGRDTFQLELAPAEQEIRWMHNGTRMPSVRVGVPLADRTVQVELALCDRQLLLALDGKLMLEQTYQPADRPLQPTSRPLGIAAEGLSVKLKQLQVFRDLYYLDPYGSGGDWALDEPLGADEFFLLGDNPPISLDSRLWDHGGLPRHALIGTVLPYGSRGREPRP